MQNKKELSVDLSENIASHEMRSPYISNVLWHFVGRKNPLDNERNYEILKKVLEESCITHPPHEPDKIEFKLTIDLNKPLLSEELVAPSVTCYCDIPNNCLDVHMKKYGKFGIAFERQLLIQHGARPVMYVPYWNEYPLTIHGEGFLKDTQEIFRGFKEFSETIETPEQRTMGQKPVTKGEVVGAIDSLLNHYLAFIKPFNSKLEFDNPDNFYMEREWRKMANFKFNSHDIKYIRVAPDYISKFKEEYPQYRDLVFDSKI